MKKLLLGAVAVATIAFTTNSVSAQIPRTFTVQGVLTDSTSKPIPNGNHTITIRLYDKISGGDPMWIEEFSAPISNGLFNLTLGVTKQLPKSFQFDRQMYVGVSYDGKEEITRIPLSTVPYAFYSENVPDGSITTSKLAESSVTSSKIADGAITKDKISIALYNEMKGEKKLANNASGFKAFIGGGDFNVANASYSSIIG